MLKPVGSEAPNSGRFSVGADRDSDKKGKGGVRSNRYALTPTLSQRERGFELRTNPGRADLLSQSHGDDPKSISIQDVSWRCSLAS